MDEEKAGQSFLDRLNALIGERLSEPTITPEPSYSEPQSLPDHPPDPHSFDVFGSHDEAITRIEEDSTLAPQSEATEQSGVPVTAPTEEQTTGGPSEFDRQIAVERLSEDERLRADLTDSAFSEILGFAVDIIMQSPNAQVIESMRPLVRALSASAGDGSTDRLVNATRNSFGDKVAGRLGPLLDTIEPSADPDHTAITYLAALRSVL